MNPSEYYNLRKKLFYQSYTLNEELANIARRHKSHYFLTNAASQVIYQYLIQLVIDSCEKEFKTDRKSLKILDWGCGKGHCTFLLNKSGVPINACDIVSEKNDSAFGQQTPIIDEYKIPVTPLEDPVLIPYTDEQFDAVISMGVLEHVQNDIESLKEIHRVLKPNGLLFCFFLPQTYSWTQYISRKSGNNYHDRLYNKKIIKALLEKSRFEIKDIWHRQLLPKNTIKYPFHNTFERIDHILNRYTFLKYLSTNIEFIAQKK